MGIGTIHRSYDDEFAENGAIAGRAGSATGGEGVDRADISLPGEQDALVRAVREATPGPVPVIAVVVAGRPHVLTDVVSHSEATIWRSEERRVGKEGKARGWLVHPAIMAAHVRESNTGRPHA